MDEQINDTLDSIRRLRAQIRTKKRERRLQMLTQTRESLERELRGLDSDITVNAASDRARRNGLAVCSKH